ncbi:hypothetical protein HD806DRAFT_487303, partial [Xylariaceae sp. AK1471]
STEPKQRRRMRPTRPRIYYTSISKLGGVVGTRSSHHGFSPRGFTGVSTRGRVSYCEMGGGNHQGE